MDALIKTAMDKALYSRLEDLFEDHKKQLIARLDRDKNEILSGITLSLMRQVQFSTMSDHIIITLRTEDIKKNESHP